MVPDPTYDEYAYRIGDENRTTQLNQAERPGGTGDEGRLRTNRFDTRAKRGASANIVETPDGDVVVVDSDYNEAKVEREIDARLGEDDSLHMVSTHAHDDHTSNNQVILDDYDVETHYVSPKHRADKHLTDDDADIHQRNGTDIVEVASGDKITIGGAAFEIDHPPRESVEETSLGSDTNENSLGVTVGYADAADPDPAVADYTARFNGDKLAAGQQSEWHRHTEKFEQREVDDTERPHHGDAKAADPDYRAAEGAQYEYINAPLYDKSYAHPNIDSFAVYDDDATVYWSSLHGDFHHDGEGSPTVEHEFSTDPQALKTVRQRVEGLKAEEAENSERYDSRFDERNDQYDPKADNPVEELRTVLEDKKFEQIYNRAEQVEEADVGEMNHPIGEGATQSPADEPTPADATITEEEGSPTAGSNASIGTTLTASSADDIGMTIDDGSINLTLGSSEATDETTVEVASEAPIDISTTDSGDTELGIDGEEDSVQIHASPGEKMGASFDEGAITLTFGDDGELHVSPATDDFTMSRADGDLTLSTGEPDARTPSQEHAADRSSADSAATNRDDTPTAESTPSRDGAAEPEPTEQEPGHAKSGVHGNGTASNGRTRASDRDLATAAGGQADASKDAEVDPQVRYEKWIEDPTEPMPPINPEAYKRVHGEEPSDELLEQDNQRATDHDGPDRDDEPDQASEADQDKGSDRSRERSLERKPDSRDDSGPSW